MKCPNCSNEAPEGDTECPLCHCVLSIRSGSVPPVPIPSAVSADAQFGQTFETIKVQEAGKLPAFLYTAALLLVAGAAWFFMRPVPGLPVPAGAYVDTESRFAVSPVAPDWVQTSSKDKNGVFIEAAAFRKPDGDGPLRASFVVFVHPGSLPDFTAGAKDFLQQTAVNGLSAVYEGYQHASTQDATVDNLKALRLTGSLIRKTALATADSATVGVSSATVSWFEYKAIAFLVQGAGRGYLLVALAPTPEIGDLQPLFETAFASFRVIERPLAYPQKVHEYSRISAMAGAAMLVILFFYKILIFALR